METKSKSAERVKVILISRTESGEQHRAGYLVPELAKRLIAKGEAKTFSEKPASEKPAPAVKPPKPSGDGK